MTPSRWLSESQLALRGPTKSETTMPGIEYRTALLALISSHPKRPTSQDALSNPSDMIEEGQR
jgi:hypothetical protein